MKNYLVILVTIGMGVAYWYQIPEPPPAPVAVETPTPPPLPQKFVAARSALDEPPHTVGGGHASNSVLLGNDKPSHLHP